MELSSAQNKNKYIKGKFLLSNPNPHGIVYFENRVAIGSATNLSNQTFDLQHVTSDVSNYFPGDAEDTSIIML